jgi:hypothetical protein
MKVPHLILSLLCISLRVGAAEATAPATAPVSDAALLSAIAEVESGNNPARVGRYGERTRLQILPTTWRQFSRLPHTAGNRAETDRVARAYLSYIRTRIRERGLPETPFYIAAAWNAGPEWRRLHRGTVAYAQRVANLVEASQRRARAAAAVASAPALAPTPLRFTFGNSEAATPASQPMITLANFTRTPAAEPLIPFPGITDRAPATQLLVAFGAPPAPPALTPLREVPVIHLAAD